MRYTICYSLSRDPVDPKNDVTLFVSEVSAALSLLTGSAICGNVVDW